MGLRNGWLYCYTYLHLKNIFILQARRQKHNERFVSKTGDVRRR